MADTSMVTVTSLVKLTISPASASVIAGSTRQFSVIGQRSDGTTESSPVTFSATGGTITAAGLYKAGTTTGSYRVIAVHVGGTMADTAGVTVTSATLTSMTLTPGTAAIPTGTTKQFVVSGTMSNGTQTTPAVAYTATGGSITTSGMYTAGTATGSFKVIAKYSTGAIADTAAVTLSKAAGATPWVSDDYSTYTSTSQMLSDPRNIYSEEDAYNTDARISLDLAQGYGSSTRSMKYTIKPTATPCAENTLGRNLKFPATVKEAWSEFYVKFSANFKTSASSGCSSNPDYKFILARINGMDGGRFDILIGNGNTKISLGWPAHEEGFITSMVPNFNTFDGQWHRYRFHYKLASATGKADGGYEVWIDNTRIYSNLASTTGTATGIYGIALARNLNQGPAPGVTMTVNWGLVRAFNSNPGW